MNIPVEAIPPGARLISAERNSIAETNNVFRCLGERNGKQFPFYVKLGKTGRVSMENEHEVLDALSRLSLPVPKVLTYGRTKREFMALSEMPGLSLSDLLDPKCEEYRPHMTGKLLFAYGEILAEIHSTPIEWKPFVRTNLYSFLGEEAREEIEFREVVLWLTANPVLPGPSVFVHGDLNTANILFSRGEVTAVLDWEFAGMGFREYDLAWVLRQRKNYMNTPKEREQLLAGYRSKAAYDEDLLRWCEVMNYLHIAYWAGDRFPSYRAFALGKARERMFAGFE